MTTLRTAGGGGGGGGGRRERLLLTLRGGDYSARNFFPCPPPVCRQADEVDGSGVFGIVLRRLLFSSSLFHCGNPPPLLPPPAPPATPNLRLKSLMLLCALAKKKVVFPATVRPLKGKRARTRRLATLPEMMGTQYIVFPSSPPESQ